MRKNIDRALTLAAAVAASSIFSAARADIITKDNNTTALNLGGSWVGGIAPGTNDIAQWDNTVAANTVGLGTSLDWLGILINSNHTGNVTFNSGNTLTLGASGITAYPNITFTLNNAITLSADQTWSKIGSGTTVYGSTGNNINTAGYTLTIGGTGGVQQFKSAITGGGDLIIAHADAKLTSGATASTSDTTIAPGARLTFDTNNGTAVRLGSLTLNGRNTATTSTLALAAATNGNQIDQIAGALTVGSGNNVVTITPNASYNARIEAGSFSRLSGTSILFRGTNLGSAPGAGVANVIFGATPALAGTGTSGNTIGIIAGAIGDTTANATGFSDTGGLVTYDTSTGVRVLAASEYQTGITDGQGYEATPIYVNASIENGSGVVGTTTLNSNTAVNSLSLRVKTTAGSGITINGTGTLKVTSGVVYGWQGVGAGATNAINIETPVDLNGQEGVILASTAGISNSTTTGRMEFKNAITNGSGLTKAGPGEVRFSGSAANTYGGTTYMNEGVLTLAKTSGINAIPGDLVINGGRVQHASSNQLPNTANITINGGTYSLQYSNTGSVFQETYNNLTMYGGNYTTGTAGHDGVSNILGTMTLAGGALGMSRSDDVNVTGLATYSGGTHSIAESNSTTIYNTLVALNGGVQITNTPSSAYTPITVGSSATNKGGKLTLGGNLTFTGNATNANTVTIAAPVNTNMGIIDLNGATRTFTIGDGAAADDLTVNPVITNGGLAKTGAGTLVLGGANTYTGPTTIMAGALKLGASGSIASALVDVSAGATLDTSSIANFAMSGSQTVKFGIDGVGAGSSALLAAAGLDITAGSVDFSTVGTLDDQAYILATYTSLTGTSFGTVNNLPANYTIDYAYMGNQIALVTIPEPGTVALAALAAGSALMLRRRSHVA